MSSPSTPSEHEQGHRFRDEHPRANAAVNALLWLGLTVLAVAPVPWW